MRFWAASWLVAAAVLALVGCAPAALTADQIVPAFIAASQAETRTMHMVWNGNVTSSQSTVDPQGPPSEPQRITLNATFDFNGDDYEGIVSTTSGDTGSSAMSYARVGGALFTRFSEGDWQAKEPGSFGPEDFDPLLGLTAADLTYAGPGNSLDGQPVHLLRVADPIAALERTLFPERSERLTPAGSVNSFVIFVDGRGTPVGAQMVVEFDAFLSDANSSAPLAHYVIEFDYRFTQWGESLTIVAPPVMNGGGTDGKPPQPVP